MIPGDTGNEVSPMGRPLDKQEAILCGEFVNAVPAMFKRDPASDSWRAFSQSELLAADRCFQKNCWMYRVLQKERQGRIVRHNVEGKTGSSPLVGPRTTLKCDRNFLSHITKVRALVLGLDNMSVVRAGRSVLAIEVLTRRQAYLCYAFSGFPYLVSDRDLPYSLTGFNRS